MKKTILDRIMEAKTKAEGRNYDVVDLDTLIYAAYLVGRDEKALEAGKAADERYKKQLEAARDSRYYKMALNIVRAGQEMGYGDGCYIYDFDYSNLFSTCYTDQEWSGD